MRPPSYKTLRRMRTDGPIIAVNVHLPKLTYELLKGMSQARDLPVSKLICYAIDNELDCDPPFNYGTNIPDMEYKEYEYAEEASKILKYLMKHFQKPGTGLDMLLLCRRDIGIEKRDRFLLGFRELLEKGLIEEFYPQKVKFRYGKDYRYYRPSIDVIEEAKSTRKKTARKLHTISEKGPLYAANTQEENHNEADRDDELSSGESDE